MDYHIIATLGKINDKAALCQYEKDENLDIAALKSGEFYNSTHCLLESFKDCEFSFIATQKAFENNAEFLSEFAPIFERFAPKNFLDEDEFDKVFAQILNSIKSSKCKNIILDITHGFRSQSIIAAFASVLSGINTRKNIQIIFAKEIEQRKKYRYVELNNYVEISPIAIALNSFLHRLNMPEIYVQDEFINALENFSRALHSNARKQMKRHLEKCLKTYESAKEKYAPLVEILEGIKAILDDFKSAESDTPDSYYKIARIMHEKEYFLISATYISEAMGLYLLSIFKEKNLMQYIESNIKDKKGNPKDIKKITDYDRIQKIKDFIGTITNKVKDSQNFRNRHKSSQNKWEVLANYGYLTERANKQSGNIVRFDESIARPINVVRNKFAHIINKDTSDIDDIKRELETILWRFDKLCITENILRNL